jgi:hypothetical protein
MQGNMIEVAVTCKSSRQAEKIKERLETMNPLPIRGTTVCARRADLPNINAKVAEYIQLEENMHQLTGKIPLDHYGHYFGAPLSILSVSATPLPILIRLGREEKTSADTFIVLPDEKEYLELNNNNMDPSFLHHNELTLKNGYGMGIHWNPKVKKLYQDAHPQNRQEQKQGVLLLDAVNPRCALSYFLFIQT